MTKRYLKNKYRVLISFMILSSASSVISGTMLLISSLFMFAPFSNALITGVASPCFDSFTTLPVKNGYNLSRDRYKKYRFRLKLLNLGIRKAPYIGCLTCIFYGFMFVICGKFANLSDKKSEIIILQHQVFLYLYSSIP